MVAVSIVVVGLLAQLTEPLANPDPSALVLQLGAARFAEREAAAGALLRLGRMALPALGGVRNSRDPEVRVRAALLVQKIEDALLTQPTRVRLDFDNVPLPEVARSLRRKPGSKSPSTRKTNRAGGGCA